MSYALKGMTAAMDELAVAISTWFCRGSAARTNRRYRRGGRSVQGKGGREGPPRSSRPYATPLHAGDAGRQRQEQELQAKVAGERAKAAKEQAQVVRLLAAALKSLSAGDLTYHISEDISETYERSRTTSIRRSPSCGRPSGRSFPRPARSRMRRPRSRPAPPTCRSAPRSRPRASSRPPPRWRRFPPP